MQILKQPGGFGEWFTFVPNPQELFVLCSTETVADPCLDGLAGQCGDDLVTAHSNVTMNAPNRHDDLVPPQRTKPGERVLIVRIDKRAIEIEECRRRKRSTPLLTVRSLLRSLEGRLGSVRPVWCYAAATSFPFWGGLVGSARGDARLL